MIRVTLFARVNTALNPYILLYKKALERQGFTVHLERELSLSWLASSGKASDVIHLHWIEAAYRPSVRDFRFGPADRLVNNRLVTPLRGVLRLINFSSTLLVAKLLGKTIVYTVHNLQPNYEEPRLFTFLNHVAHRVVLALSDHVHAHSDYARQALKTAYGSKNRVAVVPLGNYIDYYPNQISRSQARQQLGLSDEAFVYLFLGLIRPYKGVEELIEAFVKLELPHSRLLIVGRTPDADYKETIMHLSRLDPAIKLIPDFVPDQAIQLYMNACDVCVLPYRNITTSSAAILALSFGRPVIAPAITSFPELITPETGILYAPSRPHGLLSAMQQAREQSWSESAILAYAQRFDWGQLGPQLVRLYLP